MSDRTRSAAASERDDRYHRRRRLRAPLAVLRWHVAVPSGASPPEGRVCWPPPTRCTARTRAQQLLTALTPSQSERTTVHCGCMVEGGDSWRQEGGALDADGTVAGLQLAQPLLQRRVGRLLLLHTLLQCPHLPLARRPPSTSLRQCSPISVQTPHSSFQGGTHHVGAAGIARGGRHLCGGALCTHAHTHTQSIPRWLLKHGG